MKDAQVWVSFGSRSMECGMCNRAEKMACSGGLLEMGKKGACGFVRNQRESFQRGLRRDGRDWMKVE